MTTENRAEVVAIDGPVGVGKSTVARRVAEDLGYRWLDTGAMYRAVALVITRLDQTQRSDANVARIAHDMDLELGEGGTVLLDGEDITAAIRDESVGRVVHRAADNRGVREALVAQQRRIGLARPSVLEGRDIGTVVFPDARHKFYLDADPGERVRRRVAQLRAAGADPNPEQVARDLESRDNRDKARPWGALRRADDAILVDSTALSEDQVVEHICQLVRGKGALAP